MNSILVNVMRCIVSVYGCQVENILGIRELVLHRISEKGSIIKLNFFEIEAINLE